MFLLYPYKSYMGIRANISIIICSYIGQLLRYHNAFLEEGAHRSAGEIADAEGITRSFVNRNGS